MPDVISMAKLMSMPHVQTSLVAETYIVLAYLASLHLQASSKSRLAQALIELHCQDGGVLALR